MEFAWLARIMLHCAYTKVIGIRSGGHLQNAKFFPRGSRGRESIKSEAALLLLRSQYAKRYLPLLRLVILWTAEVCMLWIIRGHLQRSMQTRRFSILSMLFLCFSRKNRTSIFLTFNYNVESIFNSTGFGDFFVPKLKQSFDPFKVKLLQFLQSQSKLKGNQVYTIGYR